jgi:hypothetical protein
MVKEPRRVIDGAHIIDQNHADHRKTSVNVKGLDSYFGGGLAVGESCGCSVRNVVGVLRNFVGEETLSIKDILTHTKILQSYLGCCLD